MNKRNTTSSPSTAAAKPISVAEVINGVLGEDLPQSFDHLEKRHQEFEEAAQYLEQQYMKFQSKGREDLTPLLTEAKTILTQGLVSLVEDVSTVTGQIETLVDSEQDALSSLTQTSHILDQKLQFIKSQHLAACMLENMRNRPGAKADLDAEVFGWVGEADEQL